MISVHRGVDREECVVAAISLEIIVVVVVVISIGPS